MYLCMDVWDSKSPLRHLSIVVVCAMKEWVEINRCSHTLFTSDREGPESPKKREGRKNMPPTHRHMSFALEHL